VGGRERLREPFSVVGTINLRSRPKSEILQEGRPVHQPPTQMQIVARRPGKRRHPHSSRSTRLPSVDAVRQTAAESLSGSYSSKLKLAIAVLLALQALALVYEAWHLSLTADEPSHLTAAYMYWSGRDFLFPSDTPPLTRMMSGWMPRLLSLPFRIHEGALEQQNAYDIGTDMIARLDGASARRLIFWCRLPFLIFPLLITALIWHWGQQLFSERIALLLAACAAAEPTILGHGALIKSDVAAATMTLLFCYMSWRHWQRPRRSSFVYLLLAFVGAALTKFSLLPLLAVALLVVSWRGPRVGLALIPLALYAGIVAAYQFQIRMFSIGELDRILHFAVAAPMRDLVFEVMRMVPWPSQFLHGIGFIGAADLDIGFGGYMLGHRLGDSAPWYFPLALGVKVPVALQFLAIAGLIATGLHLWRRKAGPAEAFVWLPAIFYFLLAVRSHIHLGFRHLLPVMVLLILGSGFALQKWKMIQVLVVWLVAATLYIYPHGISYFNEWIGGPQNGWRYLVDSNIDWGQDFSDLASYVKEHHIERIRTACFGPQPLEHFLPHGFSNLAVPYEINDALPARFVPEPGIYAISANLLTGAVLPPQHSDYFEWFRDRRPEGRAGWSIYIYNVESH
jgi:hypothetical protein